ncbi:MAG: long-chain fatty acid--CoA ligase [Methylothermaceae bacteria B42]|nr:MAG: long-chain fatty acid--CoA ligase [Methylothermaceae bacteria B42]HHJ38259.1 long-chain-fatty-acid--CoA ligase [Methylothermaceae bacterium]
MTIKPWLQQYPPCLPETITPPGQASLVELFEQCSKQFADLPALENLGTTFTYHQWNLLSLRFADYLHRHLQLKPGTRIAIMLPNLLQYPVVLLGALRAGLTVVNVNPLFTPRELAYELQDSEAEAIVILENFAYVLEKVLDEVPTHHIILTSAGDLCGFPKRQLINTVLKYVRRKVPPYHLPTAIPLRQALEQGQPVRPEVTLNQEDLAFLQYTGGTTGTPKGAMLTHGNLLANIEQVRLWLTCEDWHRRMLIGEEDVVTALPLYHIFALTANLWVGLTLGVNNHLITNPRDLKLFVKKLSKIRFTVLTGVNTLFIHLMHTPGFKQLHFSDLKLTMAGGMSMQKAVAEDWQQITGSPVIEGYGLTETSPVVTLNPLDIEAFTGSIGLPLPSTDCCILDGGEPQPIGKEGELCVRGPQVMRGYWKQPEESKAVFTEDGWLRTGDIAKMDDKGFFYIVDRKKDMILVSGFNVYPNEIEQVIVSHPKVKECAAIGVPDEKTGEAIKVFVVADDPDLTVKELKIFCRANLTGYKIPKYIEFRDELPKTTVGKILRRQLKEELKDE